MQCASPDAGVAVPDADLPSAFFTKAERDVAINRLALYRKQFAEKVLKENTHDTVVMIPIENLLPRYRNDP